MDTQDPGQGGDMNPQKVVINGEEYDPTEAQELLGKGKAAREYEQKWNSPIDSLATAYGKSQTELKTSQTELQQARERLNQYEQKKDAGTETNVDTEKAREAARKLGFVLKEDIEKDGYIRKEDFAKMMDERLTEREQTQKILSDADRLEKEISGDDGRPRFNKKAVLAYAVQYGFEDLSKAYEDMNDESIKSWKAKQVEESKNPSLKTFKTGGAKSPNRPKITDDNLNEALKEVMS